MALIRRLEAIRALNRVLETSQSSYLTASSRSYVTDASNGVQFNPRGVGSLLWKGQNSLLSIHRSTMTLHSTMGVDFSMFSKDLDKRLAMTQASVPPQARQKAALKVSISSPGFIYEPYTAREKIPLWKRLFTRSGWKRTKEDMILELKSAYAIAKLRKAGYSKELFYGEAVELYKKINQLLADGDKTAIRQTVTEKMYSEVKNEIKQRESRWSKVYWEMTQLVKLRTLRARLIGVDRNNLDKVFVQLTLEFLTKQKFEAYNSNGAVVTGDKSKEVLVRDIWVFEKSLFHSGAYWRLCGRIAV